MDGREKKCLDRFKDSDANSVADPDPNPGPDPLVIVRYYRSPDPGLYQHVTNPQTLDANAAGSDNGHIL